MSQTQSGLILLDRDGTLNSMVIDPEHGTIDSPLHVSQVKLYPGIPDALAQLCAHRFGLAIVTNQPAWAKGKTTRTNLEDVQSKVIELSESSGAKILSSHICFHRSEDRCSCRKPKTGLLEEAFSKNPNYSKELSWMIGDGVTDVQAGQSMGIKTAFIGSKKWDAQRVFDDAGLRPTLWVENVKEFVEILIS
jgi:histidinol-phosphate phosphatase family protein